MKLNLTAKELQEKYSNIYIIFVTENIRFQIRKVKKGYEVSKRITKYDDVDTERISFTNFAQAFEQLEQWYSTYYNLYKANKPDDIVEWEPIVV